MLTENRKKPRGICPTCQDPNVPPGMHCRNCLCDILEGLEIGSTKMFLREIRNAKRRKPITNKMNFTEFYAGA